MRIQVKFEQQKTPNGIVFQKDKNKKIIKYHIKIIKKLNNIYTFRNNFSRSFFLVKIRSTPRKLEDMNA